MEYEDLELENTPPEIVQRDVCNNLPPSTSREKYEIANRNFMDWKMKAKAALAIGLTGACRCDELQKLKIDDMEDLNSALSIKLQDTKIKVSRNFTVTGEFYQIQK
ncbi:uncharacterized protein [Leptinotarsa decemlineata]|uniref:uncharacterized protein n=1 Tax=Leptinotarsa decemlineata TaxID=7539 RepID=UPI003D3057E9